jgi:Trp operon repressor
MVNVNKKYLEEDLSDQAWNEFAKIIKKTSSDKEIKKLLSKFFTPAEQIMFEKRLAIHSLIKQGLNQREIGRILDVSPTTVGFIKRGFKNTKRTNSKKHWRDPELDKLDLREVRLKKPRFPKYKGRGRWRFLDMA